MNRLSQLRRFFSSCSKQPTTIATSPLRPAYLDMQATTPIDFRVLDRMLPYLTTEYGNPHSKGHLQGENSVAIVEEARSSIAELLNSTADEIIFNSGATESNNTALLGLLSHTAQDSKRNHIITSTIEHKTVLEACKHLQRAHGFKVTYLDVDEFGIISPQAIESAMTDATLLVSIMALNNEIGVLQDLKGIGELCEKRNVYFHTDAAQAIGKIPLDVRSMNIDLMSFTGHKVFAPKGTGGLYIRSSNSYENSIKSPIKLAPLLHGGGQEKGMRCGTISPPMAIALGEACKVAMREMDNDNQHIKQLYDRMYEKIFKEVPLVKLNGHPTQRYFGNLNVSFKYVLSSDILSEIRGNIAFSAGAACLAEPSYVLSALKVDPDYAFGSIRIGIGRFTTVEEVDLLLDQIILTVQKLRQDNHACKAEIARSKK